MLFHLLYVWTYVAERTRSDTVVRDLAWSTDMSTVLLIRGVKCSSGYKKTRQDAFEQ